MPIAKSKETKRHPRKADRKDAIEQGERALMTAASEGMSEEAKLRSRELLLEKGVPPETINKMHPDLPPLEG